jgi:uncharacterized membrane protein YkvA (DUF1232 family)
MEQEIIEIKKPTPFPQALFKFKEYDGAKVLLALILSLSCVYFAKGLLTLFTWNNAWWKPDIALKILYFSYHMIVFTIVYCLAWSVFDRRGIEGYALSIFSIVLGVIYIASPVDFLPEPVPVIGSMDDAIIGSGSILLGVSSWLKNKKKNETTKEIAQLMDERKYKEALERFLKTEGYKIET